MPYTTHMYVSFICFNTCDVLILIFCKLIRRDILIQIIDPSENSQDTNYKSQLCILNDFLHINSNDEVSTFKAR